MEVIGTLEYMFFIRRKCRVQKKFRQTMLTLMTLLLWISPGLGDDKPPDCKAQDQEFCSSPCTYLKDRCNGNQECAIELCSYLYPQVFLRDLERCWALPSVCTDEFRYPVKRGILNKNIAYLLLKLHPFLNQTSQFGFLTSGRFRRISGSFGTEFLGKRSNNKSAGSRSSGGSNQSPPKPKPRVKFYSLPLNKLAKSKILKKSDNVQKELADSREKRLSIRGNEKVILGSEFLGKRGFYQNERIRRLSGNEFLGKRNDDLFDASEFLGKRMASSFTGADLSGKRQSETVSGTELLGKKSSRESSTEFRVKRFEDKLLGKRHADKELQVLKSKKAISSIRKDAELGFWPNDDPELVDEAFSSYESFQSPKISDGTNFCKGNDSGICERLKVK